MIAEPMLALFGRSATETASNGYIAVAFAYQGGKAVDAHIMGGEKTKDQCDDKLNEAIATMTAKVPAYSFAGACVAVPKTPVGTPKTPITVDHSADTTV